jgi:dienelactone hydrolase
VTTDVLTAPGGLLEAYRSAPFTAAGTTRLVYRGGSGPAVIVMAEIPGITPKVIEFAERVRALGLTVALPVLFGEVGREPSVRYGLKSMTQACIAKEFTSFAVGRTSPIAAWLRALAADLHEACGGPGVGAIGMCFTGGFALAMMTDAHTVAPVLSQPSLPFALGKKRKADLGLSPADLDAVRARATEGCDVLGLRFTGDKLVGDRFTTLRRELGDHFIAVEIPSPDPALHIPKMAHSVVTEHLVDEPGHPTREALDQVLAFFSTRLLTPDR